MSKDEFLKTYEKFIKTSVDASVVDLFEEFVKEAWEAGYEFRIQEEELNKGASF